MKVRGKYIFPLLEFSVQQKKLEYNNIKYIINNKIASVEVIGSNKYKLYFDRGTLIKGLIGDIEYFYMRTLVQYCNLTSNCRLSPCWNIVTQYYFNFFSVTTLLRLFHRGCLYFASEEANLLSGILTALSGEKVQFNKGNYKFQIRNLNDDATETPFMEISQYSGNGVHEQTWLLVNGIINEFLVDQTRDDEYTVLNSLKILSSHYKAKFPSAVRNTINYKPQYGYKSIRGSIHFDKIMPKLEDITRELLTYEHSDNENKLIRMSSIYGDYFFILVGKLYNEYIKRAKIDSSLIKLKSQYISNYGLEFDDLG